MTFPEPRPTPETAPYWAAADEETLVLQRCADCGFVGHRGRRVCPRCTSGSLAWFPASGAATLWSYVIVQHAEEPYAVAIVELAEGPRMTTNIVEVPQTPEALVLDMPLRVAFVRRGDRRVPVFAPVQDGVS
ncbi:MAG: OB-fold domain-containing protein [Actinophytocola sp.]|uniref:Zn-ribbon domain-containing OB-fold protein n=1 Tax=Actinophytocola sp. TaxID=1872138 RepID=UPI003C77B662